MPILPAQTAASAADRPSCAVVWINSRKATVARTVRTGSSSLQDIERGIDPEPVFLASVIRSIGECERVLVLGPGSTRLDLERQYVTAFQRPDRLVDVEPSGPLSEEGLSKSLLTLAS